MNFFVATLVWGGVALPFALHVTTSPETVNEEGEVVQNDRYGRWMIIAPLVGVVIFFLFPPLFAQGNMPLYSGLGLALLTTFVFRVF